MARVQFSAVYKAAKGVAGIANPARVDYEREARRLRQKLGTYERITGKAEIFQDLREYQAPKRITEGSVRRLIQLQEEARRRYDVERAGQKEAERQKELQKARIAVENVKVTLKNAVEGTSNAYSRIDVEMTVNALLHMINQSIQRSGYKRTYDRLKKWAVDFESKLEEIALAIYSKYYNTNLNPFLRDPNGDIGRSRFIADVKALATVLKVKVPQELETMY